MGVRVPTTKLSNIDLKFYRSLKEKKIRDARNMFLIEGVHLVEECIKSKYFSDKIDKVFIRNDFNFKKLLKKLDDLGLDIIRLDERQFQPMAETVNSQGIIAAVSNVKTSDESDDNEHLIVALDGINDPGNAGTIFRTARWFGVNKIILSTGSVDVFNSKVLRASQGSVFNLNITQNNDLKNELKKYHDKDHKIILTDLNTDISLNDVQFRKEEKYVFVFGNEAGGISKEIIDNNDYTKVKIKGYSEGESLNVAVAAGIVLFCVSDTLEKI